MRVPQESESPLDLNLVPMLDVVFSILTFFIMSTLFLSRSEGLPVSLPKAATANQQPTKIAVTIQEDGKLALNRQSIALPQLEPGVRALAESNASTVVVLHADRKVPHEQVVAALDEIRKVNGVKIAIAAQKK